MCRHYACPTEPMRELKLSQWEMGPTRPYVIFTGICFIVLQYQHSYKVNVMELMLEPDTD